jgi:hypothetical protein
VKFTVGSWEVWMLGGFAKQNEEAEKLSKDL